MRLTLLAPISQNGQTLKQFVGKLLTNCLSVFDQFMGLALKGLMLEVKFGDDPLGKPGRWLKTRFLANIWVKLREIT